MQRYLHVWFIISLTGYQLAESAPAMEERSDFFANVDYNQMVTHMKEVLMYMPVLMSSIKETMTGFPKVAEGLNSIKARRLQLGSGRHDDGKCRCKHLKSDSRSDEDGYR